MALLASLPAFGVRMGSRVCSMVDALGIKGLKDSHEGMLS
jgi:hypothetical protein